MKAHILVRDGEERETGSIDDIVAARAAGKLVWVDLEVRTPDTDRLLSEVFHIHPLTQEDIWNDRELPKVEDFGAYLYVVAHSVRAGSSTESLEVMELDVIIGDGFVVTHNRDSHAVKAVAEVLARCGKTLSRGPAWVLHALLDHLVDDYLPLIDRYDDEIEALEVHIVDDAGTPRGPAHQRQIFAMKRSLQRLRRTTIHQRELLLRLGRGEFEQIPRELSPFFRDVYDEFARVTDLVESYRELLSSALDAYLSVQSNRMNEVMKTLTLISTVMLPLTFIAGVYGMNFDRMPELHWVHGYPFALALMAATGVSITAWFLHKRWL